jgi:hypothetical protein
MKKLVYSGIFLALVGIGFVACEKEVQNNMQESYIQKSNPDKSITNNDHEKLDWPISIGITFEPLRIHRATTERPRDGKNCGCNECFGLCNAPAIGDGNNDESFIGGELLDSEYAVLFFLNKKPVNFETEFGIDEEVKLNFTSGHTIKVKTGEYAAVYEEGTIKDNSTNTKYQYFGKVKVKYTN